MYAAISIRFPIASEDHSSLPFPNKPCIYSIYRILSLYASAQGIHFFFIKRFFIDYRYKAYSTILKHAV